MFQLVRLYSSHLVLYKCRALQGKSVVLTFLILGPGKDHGGVVSRVLSLDSMVNSDQFAEVNWGQATSGLQDKVESFKLHLKCTRSQWRHH